MLLIQAERVLLLVLGVVICFGRLSAGVFLQRLFSDMFVLWLKIYHNSKLSWKHSVEKFQDFSTTRILREIKFGPFEAPKTAVLNI